MRHIGVSNETSWGVCQWAAAAEKHSLPKIVSIQNSYSLLVCPSTYLLHCTLGPSRALFDRVAKKALQKQAISLTSHQVLEVF